MNLVKAKEILGPMAKGLSNDEIQAVIDCFSSIIEVGFQIFEKQKISLTKTHIISHNKK